MCIRDRYEFVVNKEQRERFGRNARKLAESEFNLSAYQDWFYNQLSELAEQGNLREKRIL